jgi:hypothetical protein
MPRLHVQRVGIIKAFPMNDTGWAIQMKNIETCVSQIAWHKGKTFAPRAPVRKLLAELAQNK